MKTVLKYKTPAQTWFEGLPLGNGSNGMMVWGDAFDIFSLNSDRLWRKPLQKNIKTALVMPKVYRLMEEKKYREAEETVRETYKNFSPECSSYQPLADLCVQFAGKEGSENYEYSRNLDLDKGIFTSEYLKNDSSVFCFAFADMNDKKIYISYACEKPADLLIRFDREEDSACVWRSICDPVKGFLDFKGTIDGDVHFGCHCAIWTNGKMLKKNNSMSISGAGKIIITATLYPDLKGDMPQDGNCCEDELKKISKRHIEKFFSQMNRISLEISEGDNRTTEELYNDAMQNKQPAPALFEQLADMSRYMLISSSQPGSLPCNLQGIWNRSPHPEWECGFTTDMNVQMAYWQANSAGLFECETPLFDWLENNYSKMERLCEDIFGVENGAYIPQYTDVYMTPTCWPDYGVFQLLWSGAAAWFAHHYYEHWIYTRDINFLENRAVPYMKKCANLYLKLLKKDKTGRYRMPISLNPENMPSDGTQMVDTAVMDISLVRELFGNLLKIAENPISTINEKEKTIWRDILVNISAYPVDSSGMLLEWLDERTPVDPSHRHLSHLYGLFPGKEFVSGRYGKIDGLSMDSIEKAVLKRLENGLEHSSTWSFSWYANCFCRLEQPEKLSLMFDNIVNGGLMVNLLTVHNDWRGGDGRYMNGEKIFQIDALLGFGSAVYEALLFADHGFLKPLPALPPSWKNGSVKGLRVSGGLMVSLKWKNSSLVALELYGYNDIITEISLKHLPENIVGCIWENTEKGLKVSIKSGDTAVLFF